MKMRKIRRFKRPHKIQAVIPEKVKRGLRKVSLAKFSRNSKSSLRPNKTSTNTYYSNNFGKGCKIYF